MLDAKGIDYTYREYVAEPLNQKELKEIFAMLKLAPKDLLRKNDKAYKELGLTGKEPKAELIRHMAKHPTLVQRPIGVKGKRAVVGRPIENLLELG